MRHRVDGCTGRKSQTCRAGTRLHGPQLRIVGGGALRENHDGTASLNNLAGSNQGLTRIHRTANHRNMRELAHNVAEHGSTEQRILRQEARQGALNESRESHSHRVKLGGVVSHDNVPAALRQVLAAGNLNARDELVQPARSVTEHLVQSITGGGGLNLRQSLLSLLSAH